MEKIDILDAQGNKLGLTKSRYLVHKRGLLHASVHVLVFNSKGEILVQKRSLEKESFPGKWDIILGGHISSGKTPEETAVLELKEEYGLKVDLKELKFIERGRSSVNFLGKKWHDEEFNYLYFVKSDKKVNDLKLQKEEVLNVKFLSVEEIEKEILDQEKYKEYCDFGDSSRYLKILEKIKNLPLNGLFAKKE